jgi:hypothetical protein
MPVREDGTPSFLYYYEFSFTRQTDGMNVELRWRLELMAVRFRIWDWIGKIWGAGPLW